MILYSISIIIKDNLRSFKSTINWNCQFIFSQQYPTNMNKISSVSKYTYLRHIIQLLCRQMHAFCAKFTLILFHNLKQEIFLYICSTLDMSIWPSTSVNTISISKCTYVFRDDFFIILVHCTRRCTTQSIKFEQFLLISNPVA